MPSISEESKPPIVSLRGIKKSFDGRPVLQGLDLDVKTGRSLVIMGPSGCGKSVLLKHIVGLLRPDSGEVRFHGQRIDDTNERGLRPIARNAIEPPGLVGLISIGRAGK